VIDSTATDGPGRQLALSFVLLAMCAASLAAAPGPDGLMGAFLAALMLAIAVTDSRRYIIPDELTAAAVALALFRADTGPTALKRLAMRWRLLIHWHMFRGGTCFGAGGGTDARRALCRARQGHLPN
jgi:leader peptidase (prepilin peptidase)/N-methyltransferase